VLIRLPAFGVVESVDYFFLFAANGCGMNRSGLLFKIKKY
jgi:hypothetical protein